MLTCVMGGLVAGSPLAAQNAPPPNPDAAPHPRLTVRDVIEVTLARSANIALSELSAEAQAGALMQTAATFDPVVRATVLSSRRGTPLFGSGDTGPATKTEAASGYTAGVDWRLRSGIVLAPELSINRVGISTTPGMSFNTGVASLNMSVPLLRGRGGGMLAAAERAAAMQLTASLSDVSQTRAAGVLASVDAYWGYVAAFGALTVLRESEERADRLVQQTRTLIAADERPAADSIAVVATLAARRAARLSGEDAVSAARQALAQTMGIPAGQLASLPAPVDVFPVTPDSAALTAWPSDSVWVSRALARRPDLAAARLRSAAAREIRRGAQREVRWQVDFNAGVGYTGIETGSRFGQYFSPLRSDQRGFQTQFGFAYGLPLLNQAAEGQLERSGAADRQAAIAAEELARTIALSVVTSVETLRRAAMQLRLSETAVHLFTAALGHEREKFRLGTTTLFDLLTAEDNLTSAQLGLTSARRRAAAAIAQLRFATGALRGSPECDTAALKRLTTLDGGCRR